MTSGEIIRAELSKPARGYPYSYRVYLPPCFSAEAEFLYPVIYLVPGLGGGPDSWFAAGLAKILDDLILNKEIPPFISVTAESIDSDPLGETIYNELIPFIESQYPITGDRRHRAIRAVHWAGLRHIVLHSNTLIHLLVWEYSV